MALLAAGQQLGFRKQSVDAQPDNDTLWQEIEDLIAGSDGSVTITATDSVTVVYP